MIKKNKIIKTITINKFNKILLFALIINILVFTSLITIVDSPKNSQINWYFLDNKKVFKNYIEDKNSE